MTSLGHSFLIYRVRIIKISALLPDVMSLKSRVVYKFLLEWKVICKCTLSSWFSCLPSNSFICVEWLNIAYTHIFYFFFVCQCGGSKIYSRTFYILDILFQSLTLTLSRCLTVVRSAAHYLATVFPECAF